jgi:flavin-dependent dehydrogenase
MLWRAQVSFANDGAASVEGARVSCRWIVGADGQNSHVREWAGLAAGKSSARRFALRRHFSVRPWSEFVEIHWNNDGQAYVTPVGSDQVCVALISRERFLSFEDGLSGFPELAQRLDGAPPASTVRGALSISRRLLQVYRGNVALIGEASGSVDAITGEGIALAFRQALALAPALAANNLEAYAAAYRKIASLPEFMSRSMLLLDGSPGIRRRTLRAFEQDPRLFSRMLAVHVGELQLKRYGMRSLLNLGWRILAA